MSDRMGRLVPRLNIMNGGEGPCLNQKEGERMNKILGSLCVLGLAAAANASIIAGDVIAIDFGSTSTTESGWNTGVTSSISNLIAQATGVDTGVDLTIAEVAGGTPASNDSVFVDGSTLGGSGIDDIYGDGLISSGTGNDSFSLTFTGLDDSLTYNLFAGGLTVASDFGATWTISTTSADGAVQTNSYQDTEGYISFEGITSVDGTFTLVLNDISDGRSPVDGRNIGLSELKLTVIPEPATIGMLGLGAVVMMAIRRHTRG